MTTASSAPRQFPRLDLLGLKHIGPAWFTSIMGTGILAICATVSPLAIPFGHEIGAVLWSADTLLFTLFALLWIVSSLQAPKTLATILHDP